MKFSKFLQLIDRYDRFDQAVLCTLVGVENPKLDEKAVHQNRNGTSDRGLFQLNSRYFKSSLAEKDAKLALKIWNEYREQSDMLSAFGCYNSGLTGWKTDRPESACVYFSKAAFLFSVFVKGLTTDYKEFLASVDKACSFSSGVKLVTCFTDADCRSYFLCRDRIRSIEWGLPTPFSSSIVVKEVL